MVGWQGDFLTKVLFHVCAGLLPGGSQAMTLGVMFKGDNRRHKGPVNLNQHPTDMFSLIYNNSLASILVFILFKRKEKKKDFLLPMMNLSNNLFQHLPLTKWEALKTN